VIADNEALRANRQSISRDQASLTSTGRPLGERRIKAVIAWNPRLGGILGMTNVSVTK
jgi:hypothetical protein